MKAVHVLLMYLLVLLDIELHRALTIDFWLWAHEMWVVVGLVFMPFVCSLALEEWLEG